jgi:hypothetical protein
LLQTPCDPVGSTCNVSGSDSGVTVACAANQSPSDAGPSDPPGCCWLPCDPFAAESGCPPQMDCVTGNDLCQKNGAHCEPSFNCP